MSKNLDINRVQIFIQIVEAGNLTRASEILHEPKAKLGRNLSLLEEELGVQLVYRTTRQFHLTEAGINLYQASRKSLHELMSAISLVKLGQENISGVIKLTAPEDIGIHLLNDVITDFSRLYPKVSFDLLYTSEVLDLVKQGVDIAVRPGKLKDSALIQKTVGKMGFILVASPEFLKKNGHPQQLDQVQDLSTICLSWKERIGWKLYSQKQEKIIQIERKWGANNYLAVRELVLRGHGLSLLPYFLCKEDLKKGQLIQILKSWRGEDVPLQILIPPQKNISKTIRTFFDFASERLAEKFK